MIFSSILNQNQGCPIRAEEAEHSKETFLMLGVGSGEVHANSTLTFTFRTGTKAGLSQGKIKT